jgi:hypothetical protein
MKVSVLEKRIQSTLQKVEGAEVFLRALRHESHADPASNGEASLDKLARRIESLAQGCLGLPNNLKKTWKDFCKNALGASFNSYKKQGCELRERFDAMLSIMKRLIKLARNLEEQGCRIPSAGLLAHAAEDLAEMRKWYFSHWPMTLDELKTEVANLSLEKKAADYPLSNEQLLALAEKHKPPQEWFNEDDL